MAIVDTLLQNFQQAGIMRIVLPFLLVFTLTYGILRRVGLFEGGSGGGAPKRVDFALSLLTALIVVGYTPFVEGLFWVYVSNMMGATAVIVLALFSFALIFTMATGTKVIDEDSSGVAFAVGAIVVMLFIGYGGAYMVGGGRIEEILSNLWLSVEDVIALSFLALIIGYMFWIGGINEDDEGEQSSQQGNPLTGRGR